MLIAIVIPITIVSVLHRNKNRNKKGIVPKNVICYTNGFKNIFQYLAIFQITPLVCILASENTIGDKIALFILEIVAIISMLLACIFFNNWKIILYDNTFVYKNYFGKIKEYSYFGLHSVVGVNKTVIYDNKNKIIVIPYYYIENTDLLNKKIQKINSKNKF